MSEHIRYAWGRSSLGEFIAAVSGRGLVAFEFADSRAVVLNALRARLAGSVFERETPMACRTSSDSLQPSSIILIPIEHRPRPARQRLSKAGVVAAAGYSCRSDNQLWRARR